MRVIVLKPFGPYSKDHIIPDMPSNQAMIMIGRGLVAKHKDDAPDTDKALRSPVDRMIHPGQAQTKGKRRSGGML